MTQLHWVMTVTGPSLSKLNDHCWMLQHKQNKEGERRDRKQRERKEGEEEQWRESWGGVCAPRSYSTDQVVDSVQAWDKLGLVPSILASAGCCWFERKQRNGKKEKKEGGSTRSALTESTHRVKSLSQAIESTVDTILRVQALSDTRRRFKV